MSAPSLDELRALSISTRLDLVRQLWDSIVEDSQRGDEPAPSSHELAELDERLREDDEAPEAAIPWADVRARLHSPR